MYSILPIPNGTVLNGRYKIVSHLGSGGFGRTYKAEDMAQENERCVLKEFAPQVQGPNAFQKAELLFKQEAKVLYQLQNAQIPRFRETIMVSFGGNKFIFLVQEYVEGESYLKLLESRQQQGEDMFSEAEVLQLLLQLLPVLNYIHSNNVIHRDISPDNLIRRSSDGLPVLIDFGCVKYIAAKAISQFTRQPGTIIGKPGYAPDEQMQKGDVYHSSDLYALAVTALVLLTGKQPQNLYDSYDRTWRWRRSVSVSPKIGLVLDKMLADKPKDRYQSATEVLQALNGNSSVSNFGRLISQMPTIVVAPRRVIKTAISKYNTLVKSKNSQFKDIKIGLSITLLAIVFMWVADKIVKPTTSLEKPSIKSDLTPPLPKAPLNQTGNQLPNKDKERHEKIIKRREALNINPWKFNQEVNDLFYAEYPELDGRELSPDDIADAKYRDRWYQIAEDLLDKIEQSKSL